MERLTANACSWRMAPGSGRGGIRWETEIFWKKIREDARSGNGIGAPDALSVLRLPREALWRLLDVTEAVRRRFQGAGIPPCSHVTAKSALRREDHSFC